MPPRKTKTKASITETKPIEAVPDSPLTQANKAIENVTEQLDILYEPSESLASSMSSTVKVLYDYLKDNEYPEYTVVTALPNLLIDGFESEQIWEELKLQMDPFLQKADAKATLLTSEAQQAAAEAEEEDEDGADEDEMDFDEDMEGFDMDEDDEEEEELMKTTKRPNKSKQAVKAKKNLPSDLAAVEDGFFNWEDMHKFADEGEFEDDEEAKKAMRAHRRKLLANAGEIEHADEEDDDEANDDDVDIFSDIKADKTPLMYDDFFLPPEYDEEGNLIEDLPMGLSEGDEGDIFGNMEEDEDDMMFDDEEEEMTVSGRRTKTIMDGSDDEEEEEDEKHVGFSGEDEVMAIPEQYEIDDNDHVVDHLLTPYEKKQKALQEQIEAIEKQLVGPKSWDLAGETKGHKRELDVLLDKELDFEFATKTTMPVTEEVAQEIEEIIRARIRDNAFDDVQPRLPPPEKLYEPKEEVSTEKPRYGLAEIYEKEYLQMALGTASDAQVTLNKEHEEISTMFANLCHKLDALSNFFYTPKGKNVELSIVSSTPAVQMEEVLPMAISEADRAAPQEMFHAASRGLIASREEQTKEEKDSLRRLRKDKKRKHFEVEEKQTKLNALAGDESAKKKVEQKDFTQRYKEATSTKKVTRLDNTDSTRYSTSSTFFKKIQEDADRQKAGIKLPKKKTEATRGAGSYKF